MTSGAESEPVRRFRDNREFFNFCLSFENFAFETLTGHLSMSAPVWDGVGLRPVQEKRRTPTIDEIRDDPAWISSYNRKLNHRIHELITHDFPATVSQLFGHAAVERIKRGDERLASELGLTAADIPGHGRRPAMDRAARKELGLEFESMRAAFKRHFNVEVDTGILHNDVAFIFTCRNIGRHTAVGSVDVVPDAARLAEPRSLKSGAIPGEPLQFTREEVVAAYEILLRYLERLDEGLNGFGNAELP